MDKLFIILISILFYIIIFVLINNYLKPNIKIIENMVSNKIATKNNNNNNLALKFNYTVKEIEQIKNNIIKTKKDWLNNIKKKKDKNSIYSKYFLDSYMYLLDEFNYTYGSIGILQYVSSDEKIKNASIKFSLDLSKENQKMFESKENYKLFKFYLDQEIKNPLTDKVLKKIIRKILLKFENNGVHLDEKDHLIFTKISKKLIEYENNFSQNIYNDVKKIKLSKDELDGLSEDVLKEHINNNSKGDQKKYIFTTAYPDYNEIMKNCNKQETRKLLYNSFYNVAPKNLDLLEKILIYRNDLSHLLKYKSSVDFHLSDNHIATEKDITNMISKVSPILKKLVTKEHSNLSEFKNNNNNNNNNNSNLKEYDLAYYSNKFLKSEYNIDHELIKKYFPSNYTIPSILNIFGNLLGIKFNLVKNMAKWHKDVYIYSVSDNSSKINKNNNNILGYIYFDLYPRPKKYTHAMTFTIQNTYIDPVTEKRIIPICAIVCNFEKKFMSLGEINTFCHELGHGLHVILSKTKYEFFAGTSTENDFSEMPSQLLENWVYQPSFLQKISSHYKTKEPIPLSMANKLKKLEYYNIGIEYMRQILLMSYDIEVHKITNNKEITKKNLYDLWFKLQENLYPYALDKDIYPMCRFDHLMGYEANYYSYMWTNIYAMDIFSEFKKYGIYDKKTGLKYRKDILEKGGETTGKELMKNFLGRDTNEKAFFEMFS
jgi:Zn-dependent oligopeptidase